VEEEARELTEDVPWLGLGMEPMVAPIGREPELERAEVEAEFWTNIGFPTVESRSWLRSPLEVRYGVCR
jgi:hypothetical protein